MPYFRHRSFVFAPASASLSTSMICSSVNRRLFIRLLPDEQTLLHSGTNLGEQTKGGQSGTTMGDWHMGTDADGNFVIGLRSQQTVEGRCPACNREAVFSAADLAGKTHIECPFCRNVAPLWPVR